MRLLSSLATAAALVVSLSQPLVFEAHAQSVLGQREIEEALTCQCGCGLTVATCNHLECSFAVPVRKDIAESLKKGETGEQILERYKSEYGEKVLSSPVPEGFNMMAWIGPYLGIFVAGVAMFAFFRRRGGSGSGGGDGDGAGTAGDTRDSQPTDERIARLRNEVEDLKR